MHPGSPPPPPRPTPPSNQIGALLPLFIGGLSLVLIVGVIAGAMLISRSLESEPPRAAPVAAASPSPSPSPSPSDGPSPSAEPTPTVEATPTPEESDSPLPVDPLHDPCVVGAWRETSHQVDTEIGGVKVRLNGSGAIQRFREGGNLIIDYGKGVKLKGSTYELTIAGRLTYNWQTNRGQILHSNAKASGTEVWRNGGQIIHRQALTAPIDPERYTCSGNTLRQFGPTWTIEMTRVNSTGA
ncbi:hypothetical protein [Phytohabitans rumicis]|uniref:Uncharacterized protein n=1 Tax=Phytohabitans rumicis TaxID=1076125 RepID=A0A6V8LDC8_9ACTN|nr:hypothetical protein [Phytohabitans rumicis]GFJ92781.1 hypothetical protein Prum_064230 [Phytohabitans rumicis]